MVELCGRRSVAPERAWSLYALAEACQEDAPEQAELLLAEAVAITDDWDWVLLNGVSRVSLATARMRLGNLADAAGVLRDVISDWHLRGNWLHQWVALRNAVELLAEAGQTESAARLHHAIESSPSSPDVYGTQGDRLRALAARLPHPALETALSDDQIVNVSVTALDDLAATVAGR